MLTVAWLELRSLRYRVKFNATKNSDDQIVMSLNDDWDAGGYGDYYSYVSIVS